MKRIRIVFFFRLVSGQCSALYYQALNLVSQIRLQGRSLVPLNQRMEYLYEETRYSYTGLAQQCREKPT